MPQIEDPDQPKMILRQKLDQVYLLSVFSTARTHLMDIPLGTDKDEAVKKANQLIAVMTVADGFTDET